jgi:hypothetical protein
MAEPLADNAATEYEEFTDSTNMPAPPHLQNSGSKPY